MTKNVAENTRIKKDNAVCTSVNILSIFQFYTKTNLRAISVASTSEVTADFESVRLINV